MTSEAIEPGRARRAAIGAPLVGFGLGLQSRGTGKIGARLGLGTPEDDMVFAAVFAALALLGFLAIGLSLGRRGPAALGVYGVVAALLGAANLAIVGGVTSPRGFRALASRFGFDASLAGTLHADLVVAATVLCLPALALGATLFAAGPIGRRALFAAAVAAGMLTYEPLFGLLADPRGSVGLVCAGGAAASLGVAVVVKRPWHAALPLGLVAAFLAARISPIEVQRPWARFPVQPVAMFETRDGQFTIEEREGIRVVYLDQRQVSPTADQLRLEEECVAQVIEAVFRDDTPSPLSVLLFGLPTSQRVSALRQKGVTTIACTGSWWRSMPRVLEELGVTATVVQPTVAAPFDLVLALPAGALIATEFDLDLAWRRSEEALVWLPADRPVPAASAGIEQHLLASDGIERFAVGLPFRIGQWDSIRFVEPPWRQRDRLERAPRATEWLRIRPDDRARIVWAEYLDRKPSPSRPPDFDDGLAALAAAQRASSPFESPLERIVLDETTVELLSAFGHGDRFERRIIEGLARTLEAQGEVPWVFEYIAPLATGHPSWRELAPTVAWAEAQELDFDAAADRLRPIADPSHAPGWVQLRFAQALVDGGRLEEAERFLRPRSETDRELRTLLAEALVAASDPEGRRLANDLLRDDPQNQRLFHLARGQRPWARPSD